MSTLKAIMANNSTQVFVIPKKYEQAGKRRTWLISGEKVTFTIVIKLADGVASEELARNVYAKLDSISIEPNDKRHSSKISSEAFSLHKMRSVESFKSRSNDILRTGLERDRLADLKQNKAIVKDNSTIIIPIETVIDSSMEFIEAKVHIQFSIFEDIPDDSMKRFLETRKSGVQLLKRLFEEKEDENEDKENDKENEKDEDNDNKRGEKDEKYNDEKDSKHDSVVKSINNSRTIAELVKEVPFEIRLTRPFSADLQFFKSNSGQALIGVKLTCDHPSLSTTDDSIDVQKEYELASMEMSIGDSPGVNSYQTFDVKPFSVHLPCNIYSGSLIGAIFEATLLPFAEERLDKTLIDEMKVHLHVTLKTCSEGDQEILDISFIGELDMSRMFASELSDKLSITFSLGESKVLLNEEFKVECFIKNDANVDRNLLIKCVLEGSDSNSSSSSSSSSSSKRLANNENSLGIDEAILSQEQLTDLVKKEELILEELAFIPMALEVEVGLIPAGSCLSTSLVFLPIKEGLHWIKKISILDQKTSRMYDLTRILQIPVKGEQSHR